jgi:hypothetical protein
MELVDPLKDIDKILKLAKIRRNIARHYLQKLYIISHMDSFDVSHVYAVTLYVYRITFT